MSATSSPSNNANVALPPDTAAFNKLYAALASAYAPFAIQLMVEGTLSAETSRLQAALNEALAQNGLEPTVAAPVAQVDYPTCQSYRQPLSSSGRLLELVAGTDGLLFRCAHQLMDAEGLVFFATEFFRALRQEPCQGSRPGAVSLRRGPSANTPSWPIAGAPFQRPITGSGFCHEELRLTGEYPSPGAALMAALATHCDAPAIFMVPTDLRRTRNLPATTANACNALFIEAQKGADHAESRAAILTALASNRQDTLSSAELRFLSLPAWTMRATVRAAQGLMRARNRWLASALVSNVGPVALSDLSGGGFDARWARLLPFDMPGVALSVITLRHSGGLSVALSAPGCAPLQAHKQCIHQALTALAIPKSERLWDTLANAMTRHATRNALMDGSTVLTYQALARSVTTLSAELAHQGVKPGTRVLIGSGRSADTVIAMLACLRLGVTFVPVDPEWPQDRIEYIRTDCGAQLKLGGTDGVSVQALVEQGKAKKVPPPAEGRVAYILYTSGSTGQPKGVVVGVQSLAGYIHWAAQAYLEGQPATFAFCTSPAFDLTLTTLLTPLTSGGAIKVFQGTALETATQMAADTDITAIKITPAHLKLLAALGSLPPAVTLYIVGGEALNTQLALQVSKHAKVYNEYGPTEATVGCVVHQFNPATDLGYADVPIGQPIPGTVLNLELDGETPPPGEYGELILSGDSLALGYLNPAHEHDRFVVLPNGKRGYRTGDLVRTGPAGYEYGGRADRQVKLGGRRVELGEIEAIAEASGFCRTFVAYVEPSPVGLQLKASADMLDPEQVPALKAYLAQKLPAHMVPSRIENRPAALTANLKVSRPCAASVASAPLNQAMSDALAALREMVAEVTDGEVSFVPAQLNLTTAGLDSLQILSLLLLAETRLKCAPGETQLARFAANPTLDTLARIMTDAR